MLLGSIVLPVFPKERDVNQLFNNLILRQADLPVVEFVERAFRLTLARGATTTPMLTK